MRPSWAKKLLRVSEFAACLVQLAELSVDDGALLGLEEDEHPLVHCPRLVVAREVPKRSRIADQSTRIVWLLRENAEAGRAASFNDSLGGWSSRRRTAPGHPRPVCLA